LTIPVQTHDTAPDGSRTVAVRLERVVKRFGDDATGRRVATFVATDGTFPVVAVAGIDLDVYDGEFFSMLGPSGSGKTTTLRMIAGFELPSEGRILLHGQDVTTVPPFDRDVNTVFQDYALFPHMSVGDNVGYGLMVRKVPKAERGARVAEALRMVRLEGYEGRKPGQLSGGQRQRVGNALGARCFRDLAHHQAISDVVGNVHVREKRVVLEDGVDVALEWRLVRNVTTVEDDAALGREFEARDHPERRRLARAGRPEHREELTVVDRQIDAGDCFDVAETLADANQSNGLCDPRRGLRLTLDPRRFANVGRGQVLPRPNGRRFITGIRRLGGRRGARG
jgi:hypothetical protein